MILLLERWPQHSSLRYLTKRTCAVCAEVCDACARSCEKVGDMQDCVEGLPPLRRDLQGEWRFESVEDQRRRPTAGATLTADTTL
jgi:hypothetical protein